MGTGITRRHKDEAVRSRSHFVRETARFQRFTGLSHRFRRFLRSHCVLVALAQRMVCPPACIDIIELFALGLSLSTRQSTKRKRTEAERKRFISLKYKCFVFVLQ